MITTSRHLTARQTDIAIASKLTYIPPQVITSTSTLAISKTLRRGTAPGHYTIKAPFPQGGKQWAPLQQSSFPGKAISPIKAPHSTNSHIFRYLRSLKAISLIKAPHSTYSPILPTAIYSDTYAVVYPRCYWEIASIIRYAEMQTPRLGALERKIISSSLRCINSTGHCIILQPPFIPTILTLRDFIFQVFSCIWSHYTED